MKLVAKPFVFLSLFLICLLLASCCRSATRETPQSLPVVAVQGGNWKDDWVSFVRKNDDGKWVKHGLLVGFYPDGTVEYIQTVIDDVLDGPIWEFWPNGKICTRGQYKMGKPDGVWRLWNQEGVSHDVSSSEGNPK